MEIDEQAKALLDGGIAIRKEDIVAEGYITKMEINSPLVMMQKMGSMQQSYMPAGTQTATMTFEADIVNISSGPITERFYIVRAK
jgi:hypothetical protein